MNILVWREKEEFPSVGSSHREAKKFRFRQTLEFELKEVMGKIACINKVQVNEAPTILKVL